MLKCIHALLVVPMVVSSVWLTARYRASIERLQPWPSPSAKHLIKAARIDLTCEEGRAALTVLSWIVCGWWYIS